MNDLTQREKMLLSSLMYYDGISSMEGETLGDYLNNLDISSMSDENFSGGLSREDFSTVAEYIKGDPNLCELKITKTTSPNATVTAACFETASGEPIVAFEGTGGTYSAWRDNAYGGYVSDTACQREALQFVREVSNEYEGKSIEVTGHSKGGNMAMYCAIKCDAVESAVSFDGQGFSKEFISENKDLIDKNASKLTNICADGEPVDKALISIVPEENLHYLANPNGETLNHEIVPLYKDNCTNSKYGDFTDEDYVENNYSSFGIMAGQSLEIGIKAGQNRFQDILEDGLAFGIDYYSSGGILGYVLSKMPVVGEYFEEKFSNNNRFAWTLFSILFGSGFALMGDDGLTEDEFISQLEYAYKRYSSGYEALSTARYTVDFTVMGLVIDELDAKVESLNEIASRLEECKQYFGDSSAQDVIIFLTGQLSEKAEKMRNKVRRLSAGLTTTKELYESCEYEVAELFQS